MAFVHRQSCEGVKSELDLFAVPPTQTSIEHGGWIEHQPITSLDSGGPIEFVVPGAGDAYIDLANTYLLVRAKVVRGVGTDIADDTPVAPVNNWLHSLFSEVDVHLNDTLVTPSSNTYPFRAYVETLLSYGAEAKKTQLTSQLWYKDTAGHMEATQENGGNAGLVERRRHIAGSRVDNDALNGAFGKNPFHAKNNAINFLAVYVDGRQVPAKPLQPNFETGQYVRSYVNLFSATGKQGQDEGNELTRDDFGNGYTFFGFDLTPDACDGSCFHLVQKGNLRIEIHFAAPLAQTVNVVVYGESEAVLEIDKGRNIIYDH